MLPRCVDDASTGAPGDTYPADLIAFVASLEATGEPPRRIASELVSLGWLRSDVEPIRGAARRALSAPDLDADDVAALSPSLARDNVSAFVAWARALTKPPPHLQTGDSNR